jgi:hypothetical protein
VKNACGAGGADHFVVVLEAAVTELATVACELTQGTLLAVVDEDGQA